MQEFHEWGHAYFITILACVPMRLGVFSLNMARRVRIEVEGGLYHIINRGVDRQDIFHSPEDHRKFLALVSMQNEKLPFYLYAYCLMTNHIHLLIERRGGHVVQGRHIRILSFDIYQRVYPPDRGTRHESSTCDGEAGVPVVKHVF